MSNLAAAIFSSAASCSGSISSSCHLRSARASESVSRTSWSIGSVAASTDPMLQLVRLTDSDARALRKWHDEEIEPLQLAAEEKIAAARFDIEGKSHYPDATFTLRLSYGAVKGYDENGRHADPITTFAGPFEGP